MNTGLARQGTDRHPLVDMAQVKTRVLAQVVLRAGLPLHLRTVLRDARVDCEITGQYGHVRSLVVLGQPGSRLPWVEIFPCG